MVAAKGIKGAGAKRRDPRDAAGYLSCAGAHPSHSGKVVLYPQRLMEGADPQWADADVAGAGRWLWDLHLCCTE